MILTVCESLNNLGQDKRQIFWFGTQKHADENSIGFDECTVHSRPRHVHDSLHKCRMRALKPRNDMGKRKNP